MSSEPSQGLGASPDLYREIVETTHDLVVATDLDGLVVTVNEAGARAFGLPVGEIVGRPLADFVAPEDRATLRASTSRRLAADERRPAHEVAILRRGVERLPLEVSTALLQREGRPAGYVAIGRDLRGRRESEALRQAAFESLTEGILVLDRAGRILEANRGAEKLLGLARAALVGVDAADPSWDLVREDGSPFPRGELPMLTTLASAEPSTGVVVGFRRGGDGARVWASLNVHPLHGLGGESAGAAVVSFLDVTRVRDAVQALQASEERFRSVVEMVSDVITVLDTDATITYASPSAEKVLGRPPSALLGQNGFELLHPDDRDAVAARLVELLGEPRGSVTAEFRIQDKDGAWRWFESIGTNLVDLPDVGGIVLVSRDVTERRRMADALAQSEERFRSVVASMSEGIVVQSRDGQIVFSNESAKRIFGLDAEEIASRDSLHPGWGAIRLDGSAFPGEEHPAMVTLATGEAQHGVIMGVRRPSGAIAWISINTEPLVGAGGREPWGVVASFTDVTEQFESARALRLSEERFRSAFDNAAVGMAILSPEGVWLRVNPAICEILGRTEDELLGRAVHELTHPDDLERSRDYLARLNAGEIRSYTLEKRYLRKDGSTVWVLLTNSSVRDEDGKPLQNTSQFQDITAWKRAEEERDELLGELGQRNEELLAADRLKDELMSVVSHDLRTPLTSVIGYVDILLDGGAGDLNERQREFLEIVRRNAGRLHRVVNDLLLIASAEAGRLDLELADTDVAGVAATAVESAAPSASAAGVALELDAPVPVSVWADRVRLAEVLDNLLSNAIKYTPSGGRVTVRVAADGDGATIEVADTGIGVSEEDRRYLFERFFRSSSATERAVEGVGLGLSIVKAIVDAHGGAIEIESELGRGTTFRIRLAAVPVPRSSA